MYALYDGVVIFFSFYLLLARMDFISFRRKEWSLARSLAAAPPPPRCLRILGDPYCGLTTRNVQNGDELYSLSYIG